MKLISIETPSFLLDGGAMFGIVPKSIWQKYYPADENNLCKLANRLLLIIDGERKILIDAGIGGNFPEKIKKFYFVQKEKTLIEKLKEIGLEENDITDIVFTHLHFDHCGGALKYDATTDKTTVAFPKANLWISDKQWKSSKNPNEREKASFFKENLKALENSGNLKLIEKNSSLTKNIELKLFEGHTNGQIIPHIKYKNRTIVYAADFIPSSAHIPINYVVGYDIRPLITMQEKEKFLKIAVENNFILFFEHDTFVECCTIKHNGRKYTKDKVFTIKELN